jgi:hypothetical protein
MSYTVAGIFCGMVLLGLMPRRVMFVDCISRPLAIVHSLSNTSDAAATVKSCTELECHLKEAVMVMHHFPDL